MASTLTTFATFLKRIYTDGKVENLLYQEHPELGMVQKKDLGGESLTVPIITKAPQGIAGQSRSIAQGAASQVGGEKFVITTGDYLASVYLGHKVMKATRSNAQAFFENSKAEIDALYGQMSDNLCVYFWGNGGGALGQIASIASDVITLTDASHARNFHINMECALSEGDGSSSGHTLQAGTFTIAAVDPGAGTITGETGEIAALTGEDADDYIFRYGDFNGDTGTVVLHGMQEQLTGGSTPGALYGMTRTADKPRLAGCWVPSGDLTTRNIEQRIVRLGTLMRGRFRSKPPTDYFLNPEDWEALASSLGARAYVQQADNGTYGYNHLSINSGGVNSRVFMAAAAPKGTAWGLNTKNWWLGSIGKLIEPVNLNGQTLLLGSTTDTYEYRLASYPALWTNAPLWSGRVSLT